MADNKSSEGKHREELADGCYTETEINLYEALRRAGLNESKATEALSSFSVSDLNAIVRFQLLYGRCYDSVDVRDYERWFAEQRLSTKVNLDLSEGITGLKAIQREAKKATAALKELEVQRESIVNPFDESYVCEKCGCETIERIKIPDDFGNIIHLGAFCIKCKTPRRDADDSSL